MQSFRISDLDYKLKWLIGIFLVVLSIGFYTGISFVDHTTSMQPKGIEENYLGNEDNEAAEEMKFMKSEYEMKSILHTHFLSLSVVFLIIGFFVFGCEMPYRLKSFLMIEPMLSVLFTFGGIYLVWKGLPYISYIVMISGILMTISYSLSIVLIVKALFKRSTDQKDYITA